MDERNQLAVAIYTRTGQAPGSIDEERSRMRHALKLADAFLQEADAHDAEVDAKAKSSKGKDK